MLKTGDKTESFVAALVSRFSVAMFGVKYDATADGAKWVGTEWNRPLKYPHAKMRGSGVS